MTMTAKERSELLSEWIQPSSANEKQQQERAQSMVEDAMRDATALEGTTLRIYAKGSYPNNTNVRRESDVDIVVEPTDCTYWDYASGVTPAPAKPSTYKGPWTFKRWREVVTEALVEAFDEDGIDTSGKVAINVLEVPGSRPSIDVVPSFQFERYNDTERTESKADIGSCVFPSDSATKIINWPHHQLEKGRAFNILTGGRYKNYVRALKNVEDAMVKEGLIEALPSYFMECLVFNTDKGALQKGSLDAGFSATIVDLWEQLQAEDSERSMVEPNWMKWLFTSDKKWTLQDGKDLIKAAWNYLDYAS